MPHYEWMDVKLSKAQVKMILAVANEVVENSDNPFAEAVEPMTPDVKAWRRIQKALVAAITTENEVNFTARTIRQVVRLK